MNFSTTRWRGQQRLDYEAGYDQGYQERQRFDQPALTRATVTIGNDNNIRWDAPVMARVYVQVDNHRQQLFAEGQKGVQLAPWIERGHIYTFIVYDFSGNELARDTLDLR